MESESELNREFGKAFDNPKDFDFGFVEQRQDSGFANFGFDPDVARAMRDEEYEDEEDFDDDFDCDDEDCNFDHDDDWSDDYDDDTDEWDYEDDDSDDFASY